MMKEFDVELGRILRTERESHGLSLQQMADALGCTKMAVSYWENGKRSMYAETLLSHLCRMSLLCQYRVKQCILCGFLTFLNLFDCRYYEEHCHIFVWILWGFFWQQKKPAHRPA